MTSSDTRTIRVAGPADLHYILHLQRTYSNHLGFLTTQAHREYIARQGVLLTLENDEPCGYINFRISPRGLIRIPQIACDPEVLRTSIGTKLINHLRSQATEAHCYLLRALSRTDTPAHLFLPAVGFKPTAIFPRPSTRALPVVEWSLSLLPSADHDAAIAGLLPASLSAGPRPTSRPPIFPAHTSPPDDRQHRLLFRSP